MRKVLWVLLCVLSTTVACAESAKDAAAALQASIGNSQLVLTNFSGEDKVRASWTGTALELDAPRWQTMGVLVLDSVRLHGKRLTLECTRHVAVRDAADKIVLFPLPTRVDIDVDLGDADPNQVLPKLKDLLFYSSIGDALAALPKDRKGSIPGRMDFKPAQQPDPSKPACDCATDDRKACSDDHRKIGGIVPPKFLGGRDPQLTDEARTSGLDTTVEVALKVDAAGRPYDIWVLRPSGMGLDEEAAKAVLTSRFRPAMCHDKPVAVYLNVDVRFQRY